MHLLTQSALLRALGWSLFNSLWQMAFLWLVYVVFTNIFKRASANARHGLAVLLLGAGTLWAGLSFFNAFFYTDPVMTGYEQDLPLLAAGRQLIIEGLPYFSTVYLLTLGFLFARYSRQYIYSRQLSREGLSKVAPGLRIFAEQTALRMGIKKNVKVWLSALVEGPVTLGAWKPVILIPLATLSHLTTEQAEALILHELAHIRRQDYLLHLWIAALEVLFFFNPFSKLLIRSIQKEREHRCDDLVLQFRYDPHAYVAALLALAKGIQGIPRLAVAATGSHDGLLLQRVKRILKGDNAPEPMSRRPLIFLFFTLFMTGMILSKPAFLVTRTTTEHLDAAAETQAPTTISFVSFNPGVKDRQIVSPPAKPTRSRTHTIEGIDRASKKIGPPLAELEARDDVEEDADADDVAGIACNVAQPADPRDYSITTPAANDVKVEVASTTTTAPAPYVPNSSFSIQYMQDSTTLPGEQYVYLQQMAMHEVELAINKMQKELQIQLKLLQQAGNKDLPDLKQKRLILLEQLKLQQQYLEKQQELQKKLQRIGRKKVIVFI